MLIVLNFQVRNFEVYCPNFGYHFEERNAKESLFPVQMFDISQYNLDSFILLL